MRIKFKKGDPRAGMVAEVEGNLAKRLIAEGAAEEVASTTDGRPADPSEEQKAVVAAAKNPTAAKPPAPAKPEAKGKGGTKGKA